MINREQLKKDIQQKLKQCGLNGVMDISMTPEVDAAGWPQVYVTFPIAWMTSERVSYAKALSEVFRVSVGYRSSALYGELLIISVGIDVTKYSTPGITFHCYDSMVGVVSPHEERQDIEQVKKMIEDGHTQRMQKNGRK